MADKTVVPSMGLAGKMGGMLQVMAAFIAGIPVLNRIVMYVESPYRQRKQPHGKH
ncbi:MAG: hypothetical protein IJM41_05005 [Bacteroidales bacterium]|nr:hypothetical protein [Bacteroidales bacterium]